MLGLLGIGCFEQCDTADDFEYADDTNELWATKSVFDTDREEGPIHMTSELQPPLLRFDDVYRCEGAAPIGKGTFSTVWRCLQKDGSPHGNERYAAKLVNLAELKPDQVKRLFGPQGEIQTQLDCKSTYIVSLVDQFVDDHRATLIMELCSCNLLDALKCQLLTYGQGFTENAVVHLARHMLSGIAFLHNQGILHRDIKCENIMLKHDSLPLEQNVCKICDLGIVARGQPEFWERVGTPHTMAPEVAWKQGYHCKVDCWSAGVVLFMALWAEQPYWADTPEEAAQTLSMVHVGKQMFASQAWGHVSCFMKELVDSLMRFDVPTRLSSKKALSSALSRSF
eukprot:TRINITY_DN10560_c0_g1_i2.p1 TRINITY_DN10560_c0_g1~~TRINITY_DN10560_c0_g1_i2.p1  ORF type:complete len:357 (-),score=70.56 TRINITY_DN10560_c0_g1_i2:53-1069(-)